MPASLLPRAQNKLAAARWSSSAGMRSMPPGNDAGMEIVLTRVWLSLKRDSEMPMLSTQTAPTVCDASAQAALHAGVILQTARVV